MNNFHNRILLKTLQNSLMLLLWVFPALLFSQPKLLQYDIKAEEIRQDGFTLNFSTDVPSGYSISLHPINKSSETLHFFRDLSETRSHRFELTGVAPSSIFRANIKLFDFNGDTLYFEKSYATASRSAGDIIVYFNHEVDHTYSIGEDAVSVGSAMRDTLISYINRAKESLDIAIYNSFGDSPTTLISGAINDAYARGVQIRIIYNGSTSNTMIDHLNPAIPVFASPTGAWTGLMHHKFVIADVSHSDPDKTWVWTGSTNWTQTQINGPDRNAAIILYDQTLALTYKMEFEEMWGSSGPLPNPANAKFGSAKADNTPKEFVVGGIDVELYFSPSDNTEQQIINFINNAQHNLTVATMLITRENIADALLDKYNSGVNSFAILLDNQNPMGSQKPYLMENLPPEKIKEFSGPGQMHHKLAIADNNRSSAAVLTGSHNWSASAEQRNDENTLIIYDKYIANQYYQAIGKLFGEMGGVLTNNKSSEEIIEVGVYPNPASGKVFISSNNDNSGILSIYDIKGRLVYYKNFGKNEMSAGFNINIENYNPGLYIIRIQSENFVFTEKLFVY